MIRRLTILLALTVAIAACGDDTDTPVAEIPYDTLSEYGFFEGALTDRIPAENVVPYVPISPLWADHADKGRYIVLPEGTQLTYVDEDTWEFPIGTVLIKTFILSTDLSDPDGSAIPIETRLLIRDTSEQGWSTHTYVWNDERTEAVRTVAGTRVELEIHATDGTVEDRVYLVPNTNQCRDCHGRDDITLPLGVNSVQLDAQWMMDGAAVNHVDVFTERGLFAQRPPSPENPLVFPADDVAPLDTRARSYLHANCAHCHRPGGDAGRTGLDLRIWQNEPERTGICKRPVAAGAGTGGHSFDIVPGHPEESILPYRMRSTDPEIRMPELPSRLVDDFGVTLVEDYISSLEGVCLE